MPKLPHSVGAATDLMIGIQYLKYFPKLIFRLPNGLTIYESQFVNSDGSRGLVGDPHRIFTEIRKNLNGSHLSMSAYVTNVVKTYKSGFKASLEVPFLGFKESDNNMDLSYHVVYTALSEYIKTRVHLTDSQIALFWINNTKSQNNG